THSKRHRQDSWRHDRGCTCRRPDQRIFTRDESRRRNEDDRGHHPSLSDTGRSEQESGEPLAEGALYSGNKKQADEAFCLDATRVVVIGVSWIFLVIAAGGLCVFPVLAADPPTVLYIAHFSSSPTNPA